MSVIQISTIDSRGTARRIAILWNPTKIEVEGWMGLPRILSGTFRQIGSQERLLISIVYGPPILGEILASWRRF